MGLRSHQYRCGCGAIHTHKSQKCKQCRTVNCGCGRRFLDNVGEGACRICRKRRNKLKRKFDDIF